MLCSGSVIKGNIFADWKTAAVMWASKFRQYVLHVNSSSYKVYSCILVFSKL